MLEAAMLEAAMLEAEGGRSLLQISNAPVSEFFVKVFLFYRGQGIFQGDGCIPYL